MKLESLPIWPRIQAAKPESSTATTPRGILKAVLKDRSGLHCRKQLPKPWLLDRLQKGDNIILTDKINYGYLLMPILNEAARKRAADAIGRRGQKRNYSDGTARIFGKAHQARWVTINYRGAYKGYTGAHLYRDYQSCVAVSGSGKSALVICECVVQRRIKAPAGMVFKLDLAGILLRRSSDGMDYHLTNDDWYVDAFAAHIRRKMAEGWALRRAARRDEQKNQQAIRSANRRGVRVGLADSLAAGNCRAGTEAFARRHNLNVHKWYSPGDLLSIANGDAQRVRLAVTVAVRRHDCITTAGAELFYPQG